MIKPVTVPKLLAQAALVMLMPAMVLPAFAHGPQSTASSSIVSGPAGAQALSAAQANEMPTAGLVARGVAAKSAAPRPATGVKPISLPTPLPVVTSGYVNAPGLYNLQASASTVTVKWYDRSVNELGFKVFRRDQSGNWQMVDQVASRNVGGSGMGNQPGGSDYSWVDTSTNLSGQCYRIGAYNVPFITYTDEECTVRPDPSRFPQTVPGTVPSWSGLSDTNDGTGSLVNKSINRNLKYGDETWGVNLTYGDSSLWRVEAQGGPRLMKGQAVALKVWGGGWLKYGHQTWGGAQLQLSDTPVYEWYAIGLENDPGNHTWAGSNLTDGGTFALWNSSARSYLVPGYQELGVSLNWYDGSPTSSNPNPTQRGVKTEQVLNCSFEQHPVEVFIADQTAGGGFVDKGRVNEQYGSAGCPALGSTPLTFSPISGHQYLLVATDSSLSGCDGTDDPQEGACAKMTAQFVGDASGFTRTDIVDDGTQITP